MSAHTPGPWHFDNGQISAPNGRTLIDVDAIGCESEDEHHANARLIAAAPELYEALRKYCEARALNPAPLTSIEMDAENAARAALAKVSP